MSSAGPKRLTDDLWLAAHDSVNGKPKIGQWPLAVGLATGLLAELVYHRRLELRDGELFRDSALEAPDDPALLPVLAGMANEERSWPTAPVAAAGPPPMGRWGSRAPQDDWPARAHPADRHRQRGHDLDEWISYLAYEDRAERRVIERLSRTGLIRQEERRRLFGGITVRYRPNDSFVAGTPANAITSTLQSGRQLSWSGLFLAGLFLATGLHHHALATLSAAERSLLTQQLNRGLHEQDLPGLAHLPRSQQQPDLQQMSRELLRAANAAVGAAAMR
jgi:Golgi phosphoprotein 3 GPP34